MRPFISVIIPNRNRGDTIEHCLKAAFSSSYQPFQVIVVDDYSDDGSVELIKNYPCTLIRLGKPSGASVARNIGAHNSQGDILFFTDADCLLQKDTLSILSQTIANEGSDVVVGGTYTPMPYDRRFFSLFQSVFVNYCETKRARHPDYIAAHAMALSAETFRKSGGFAVDLPILEDVEFSHRLRRAGYKLVVNPKLQVKHIFNYSLFGSLGNALRKSMYWTIYSLKNRDLLSDSGTASIGLKVNGVSYFLSALSILITCLTGSSLALWLIPFGFTFNLWANWGLFKAMHRTAGLAFAIAATLYYIMVYPLAVDAGALAGAFRYLLRRAR